MRARTSANCPSPDAASDGAANAPAPTTASRRARRRIRAAGAPRRDRDRSRSRPPRPRSRRPASPLRFPCGGRSRSLPRAPPSGRGRALAGPPSRAAPRSPRSPPRPLPASPPRRPTRRSRHSLRRGAGGRREPGAARVTVYAWRSSVSGGGKLAGACKAYLTKRGHVSARLYAEPVLASVYPLVTSRAVARPFTYRVPEDVGKGAVVSIRFGRAAARGVVVATGV